MSADLLNAPASETADVAAEFRRLKEWWNREIAYLSNMNQIVRHPAYQAVIALGPAVVPILLRELETDPHWWFEALRRITGENPAQPDDRGDLRRLSAVWLRWGREHGAINQDEPGCS